MHVYMLLHYIITYYHDSNGGVGVGARRRGRLYDQTEKLQKDIQNRHSRHKTTWLNG